MLKKISNAVKIIFELTDGIGDNVNLVYLNRIVHKNKFGSILITYFVILSLLFVITIHTCTNITLS